METTTTTTCGDLPAFLPEDVLIRNILVCLPVKSLLRFKSVCKSWRQLIQTPFFIDLHTTTTTTTTTFNSSSSSSKFGAFIVQTIGLSQYESDIELYMLSSSESGDGDHGDGTGEDGEEDDDDHQKKKVVFKVDDLEFLPFYKDYLLHNTLSMVGSCNGIICLHDSYVMDEERGCTRQLYLHLRDVCLWNPATRQFRILPKSIPNQEEEYLGGMIWYCEEIIAFGFDVKTKDYKVLRIRITTHRREESEEEEGGCMCHVQVYSLSTDSWRLFLEGINSLPAVPSQYHCLNNHVIYLQNGRGFMLSLDFTKEIFTTMHMQLPAVYNNSSIVSSCYVGREKLAVFTTPSQDYDGDYYEYYDICVLNEQHCGLVNKESCWTKLHSIRLESSHTVPRCISNNGESNKLWLFDLITKEAKKDFLFGTRVCRADVYKESLVSIMGGGNDVLLRWQLPTHGTTYKLNLDAPFISPCRPFGIGLCLTSSDTGGCIGVRSLKAYGVRDATQGEALAMLEAIKWAIKLELSPIIVESDSKNVVSFFMEEDDDFDNNSTYWSSLLSEAKLLLNSSEISISFKYVSRRCNYVADIAAKLGREGLRWSCKDWTANFPGEMVRSLSKDLGLESWWEGS